MTKLFHPYMSWRAVYYVLKVLVRGKQLAEGPLVKQFEYEFGKKFRKGNVVAVNSGTSALELAYDLCGINKGDEVIVPVLTCTATNIPLVRRQARIVFADINSDLNINIEDVKRKITKKTKAVVFVHFGGNNAGLRELVTLCNSKGIVLIEDAAQAVGSVYWGRADYTCVSLQAIKTLTTGDGGILICRDSDSFRKAKRLRWFGYDREEKQKNGDADLKEAGYKYQMNDIAAAIGLGNLQSVDKVIEHRKVLKGIYKEYGITCHAWLAVAFGSKEKQQEMRECGIEVGQHHFRNDKYTIFGGKKLKLPVMNELEDKYFFVPYHHKVTYADAHRIGKLYKYGKN